MPEAQGLGRRLIDLVRDAVGDEQYKGDVLWDLDLPGRLVGGLSKSEPRPGKGQVPAARRAVASSSWVMEERPGMWAAAAFL